MDITTCLEKPANRTKLVSPRTAFHKPFFPIEHVLTHGRRVALLIGGPYDQQDILVSAREWADGTLARAGSRYESNGLLEPPACGNSHVRAYLFVDVAMPSGTPTLVARRS